MRVEWEAATETNQWNCAAYKKESTFYFQGHVFSGGLHVGKCGLIYLTNVEGFIFLFPADWG